MERKEGNQLALLFFSVCLPVLKTAEGMVSCQGDHPADRWPKGTPFYLTAFYPIQAPVIVTIVRVLLAASVTIKKKTGINHCQFF